MEGDAGRSGSRTTMRCWSTQVIKMSGFTVLIFCVRAPESRLTRAVTVPAQSMLSARHMLTATKPHTAPCTARALSVAWTMYFNGEIGKLNDYR